MVPSAKEGEPDVKIDEQMVKLEFQKKFKLLYGYESEHDSEDEEGNRLKSSKVQKKDKKFGRMMQTFEDLQGDL